MRFSACRMILVLFLLFIGTVLHGDEQAPLYPTITWVCSEQWVPSMINAGISNERRTEGLTDFPSEIDAAAGWSGIIVTDGNDQWTIMSLEVRRFGLGSRIFTNEKIDDKEFRERLLKTAVVSMLYWQGKTKMILRQGRLYLLSNDFPVDRLDELNPEQKWESLREKYRIAFLNESPGWTLYPELPPEKENEGTFLKKVRAERSKPGYVMDDSIESTLLAANWDERGNLNAVQKTKLKEGTEKSQQFKERQSKIFPFGLAGFLSEREQSMTVLWRWYPGDRIFGETKLLLKGGVALLELEEQVEEEPKKTKGFKLSFAALTDPVETIREKCLEEGLELMDESNLLFATPIYSDKIAENKDYLSAKSENDAFRKCLEAVHDLMRAIRTGSEGWEQGTPVDLGIVMDVDTLTFTASTPPGGTIPETLSLRPLIIRINEFLETLYPELKEKYDYPMLSLQLVHDDIENTDGTKFSFGQIVAKSETKKIPFISFLSAVKDNELYAFQITTKGISSFNSSPTELFELSDWIGMNELKERNYTLFKWRVEESLLGKRENRPAPANSVRLNASGINANLTERFAEREHTYSLTLHRNSLGILALLPSLLGPDMIKRFSP